MALPTPPEVLEAAAALAATGASTTQIANQLGISRASLRRAQIAGRVKLDGMGSRPVPVTKAPVASNSLLKADRPKIHMRIPPECRGDAFLREGYVEDFRMYGEVVARRNLAGYLAEMRAA